MCRLVKVRSGLFPLLDNKGDWPWFSVCLLAPCLSLRGQCWLHRGSEEAEELSEAAKETQQRTQRAAQEAPEEGNDTDTDSSTETTGVVTRCVIFSPVCCRINELVIVCVCRCGIWVRSRRVAAARFSLTARGDAVRWRNTWNAASRKSKSGFIKTRLRWSKEGSLS